MKNNICVAIQIKSSDFKQNENLIKAALNENPHFIELRFDYIDNIQSITESFSKQLLQLIQPTIPAIFTFRDYNEGGQIKVDDKERLKILKILIKTQPEYFDIEMNSSKLILDEILFLAIQNNVTLIFSHHDFEKSPTYEEGFNIIQSFMNKLVSKFIVDSKMVRKSIYKLIFTAQKFEDNLTCLELCKTFSIEGHKIICFCMSDLGTLSRLLCVKTGSFLTYGSIENMTAPGQINVRKMKKFYELLML